MTLIHKSFTLTLGFWWKPTGAWAPIWCPYIHDSWQLHSNGQRSEGKEDLVLKTGILVSLPVASFEPQIQSRHSRSQAVRDIFVNQSKALTIINLIKTKTECFTCVIQRKVSIIILAYGANRLSLGVDIFSLFRFQIIWSDVIWCHLSLLWVAKHVWATSA